MAIRCTVLLLLSISFLASGLPYWGVKSPRRYDQSYGKYDFSSRDEVLDKPKVDKPYEYEAVEAEDEPTIISVEDQKETYEGKDIDSLPSQENTYVDKDADLVPDEKDVLVDKGADLVPDQKNTYIDKDIDYVPDQKDPEVDIPEQKDSYVDKDLDFVPDQKDTYVDKEIDIDYIPDKKDLIEDKELDYVPDKKVTYEDKESALVPDIKETPGDITDHLPDVSIDLKGFRNGEEIVPEEKTWYQSLHEKWNKFEDNSREAARALGNSVHSAFKNIHGTVDQLWGDFKNILSHFGLMIQRGAHYVFKVVTTTVEEVKASKIIHKLEQRLEQGNEIVDEFFQKVGEKITHWMEKHNHGRVDEGFILDKDSDQKFPDIFQDPEIHEQVNKMVAGGIITQEEADMLSQRKHEFGLFDQTTEEKLDLKLDEKLDEKLDSDSYGHEGKIIEQEEGSGADFVDQAIGGKLEHDVGVPPYSQEDSATHGKSDIDGSIAYEDQETHHSIKKELDGKDTYIEETKQIYPQIEERPYVKGKGGHSINFPKW